jgi:iron(III) transport system substrate-binding protein
VASGCGSSGGQAAGDLPASAADAGGLDALVRKAKQEGVLSLYAGTTQDDTTAWVKHFEDKYGIKVKIYRDGSTTLYAKWAQETQAGVDNADVLIQNVYQLWQDAQQRGWIAPYRTQGFSGFDFKKLLPPGSDLVGTVYPLYQSIGAIVWNTKTLSSRQQALLRNDPVAALADPSFKGQIALADPGGATTVGDYANIILNQGGKYGWKWAQAVARNQPAGFESQVPIAAQLVKGEFGVTISSDTLYNDFLDQGAPIEYRYPKPTSSALWMFGLPAKTPHPYAARLFMEWASSKEAQDLIYRISGGLGSRKGWHDTRSVAKEPWYRSPTPWYGASTDARLQGQKLQDFIDRVDTTLGFG